jgi:hypothetical protein
MRKTSTSPQTFPRHLSEEEQRKQDDYEWALHDPAVRARYGGKIVVVYRKKVLGAGKSYESAWAAAQRRRDCPAKQEVAMPLVPHPATAE